MKQKKGTSIFSQKRKVCYPSIPHSMMIKNIAIFYLSLILLFPFVSANALPGNAELVLENIQIEPPYLKKGELTMITADVYNAGLVETDSFASIITAAYFVDGKLLFVGEIGNVKPGIGNKIKISSDLIWNAETGEKLFELDNKAENKEGGKRIDERMKNKGTPFRCPPDGQLS